MAQYDKNAIVEIFMSRDSKTRQAAEKKFVTVAKQIAKAANKGDYEKAEDALYKVGLELDYLDAFLY